MKVGILTFHKERSYGAVLQCYALQKVLSDLGNHEVYVLDHVSPKMERTAYTPFDIRNISGWRKKKQLRNVLDKFLDKHINTIPCFTEDSDELKTFDVIITGSDQVWNTALTGSDAFFFPGLSGFEALKYSYAASIGDIYGEIPPDLSLIKRIDRLEGISVREKQAVDFLKNHTKKAIYLHPDPVLLLTEDLWLKFVLNTTSVLPKVFSKKYILVYGHGNHLEDLVKIALEEASKKDCEVVLVSDDKYCSKKIKRAPQLDPAGFVEAVMNSEGVVTNAYHTLILAFIFGKRYYAGVEFTDSGRHIRCKEFLRELHLKENTFASEPDYSEAKALLYKKRKEALDYLGRILERRSLT